ncbi:MAG: L,D-transpeptidase family protein [Phycisphaerales bacterium]
MALPSQTERQTEIGRSYVYSQRTATASGVRLAVIIAIALIVAAGAVWGLLTVMNRRSATGTLPPGDGKSEVVRSVAPTKPATHTPPTPTSTASFASTAPATPTETTQPKLTPAGGSNPSPVRTDAPIAPPSGTPTTTTPAVAPTTTPTTPASTPTTVPASDGSGRPAAVDVTRKDLTPGSNSQSNTPTTPGQSTSLVPAGSTSEVTQQIQAAEQRAAAGDLVQARMLFNKALHNPNAVRDDQERIRQKMTAINADLLFSPKVFPGDAMAETYVVKSGDNLIKIARNREVATDWRLLERVNGVKGNSLKVGQKLKLVRGPFHVIVHKGDYRLDLFQGSPDDPESWMFIRSFKVGLGTGNSTPIGNFVVKPRSKLVNPHWVNPQTGQKFDADDPKNPIGEFWMGIEGVGDSKTFTGYGLHGTIEPDSIGQQKSMGCVRLGDEDIKLLYEMLVEQISDVKIVQ